VKTLIKKSVCQNTKQISTAPEKQSVVSQKNNRLFRRNNRLFIPVHKYKTEFKEFKDRENEHTGLYWFTLNQELHPVFPETTGESLSNQP